MEKAIVTTRFEYERLIDEETWAFIRRVSAEYPADTQNLSFTERREIYRTICRADFAGYPHDISVLNETIELPDRNIGCRVYEHASVEAQIEVLFYHGGGFVVGDLDSHDDVCSGICEQTGYRVTSVAYRKAPEHPFPSCYHDALAAFFSIAEKSRRPIILCGDSAGGNLCAAISRATRGQQRRPEGQILIYPGLTGDYSNGTYVTHAQAPLLTVRDLKFFRKIRSPQKIINNDPRAAPLSDTDFSNLPPTVIFSAECDPLSGDGKNYCDAISDAGGKAVWFNEKGLVHGYLSARHSVTRARDSFNRIVKAISVLGRGEWPYG